MALILEDGSGLATAQTYVDEAFADAYFLLRGITDWAALINKEALIIQAMDYIEAVYSEGWKGTLLVSTQALSFPRVIDGDTIYPDRLKNAVCELAYKANTGTLLIDIQQRTVKEEVGDIKVTYAEYGDQKTQYAQVYNLIKPYLETNRYSHKVERV